MRTLATALRLDVRLQARSRLYHIGVGVAILLGVGARFFFPASAMGRVLPAFYLLGLGGTTYMFGASMVLMERSERTLEALRVTRLRDGDYILAKATTLTCFAAVEAAIVLAIAARGTAAAPMPLLAGVLVLGVVYTLIGLGQVAPHDSVTRFLVPGALLVTLVLQLPFLSVLDAGPAGIWYAIPTQAPLLLMQAGFVQLTRWQWLYAIVVSALLLAGAWVFARARFRTYVRLGAR